MNVVQRYRIFFRVYIRLNLRYNTNHKTDGAFIVCRNKSIKKGAFIMENEEIKVKVKVCKKCGLTFSEKTKVCEVCGSKLGEALDYEAAENLSEDIAEQNEEINKRIANEKYGSYAGEPTGHPGIEVTAAHKIIGVVSVIVIAALIAILIFAGASKTMLNNENIDGNFYGFNIGVIFLLGYLSVFYCFWPNEFWMFNHMFDWIHYNENLTPTDFTVKCGPVVAAFFDILGVAAIIFDLWLMFF